MLVSALVLQSLLISKDPYSEALFSGTLAAGKGHISLSLQKHSFYKMHIKEHIITMSGLSLSILEQLKNPVLTLHPQVSLKYKN